MFQTIVDRIAEYHKIPTERIGRPLIWFGIFSDIRKAFYAEQISWAQYTELMNRLGTE